MSESDDQKKEILYIKRFGYVISAILIIITNISLIAQWSATPILFLITMYFLTGALWIPALIRPFYNVFIKNYITKRENGKNPEDYFKKN